ncbi:hypothetical protein ACTFIU_002977 [Dictyostelium citrinum]
MNLNVYEGTKAVRKVKSLEDESSQGTNLGVLPFGVSVLLSKNHVEFVVTLEAKKSTNEPVWLGFYFSSSFLKFQKIFKKSNGPLIDIGYENISAIIHKNLVTKFEDPYTCPLYITGTNDTRAYWTIFTNNQVVGHIPLHRSDSFHSLQSYPVLYLENDIQIVLGTDLDRNQLFPSYSKVDTLYSSTLHNINSTFSQNKWSATVIPLIKESSSSSSSSSSTTTTTNETASNDSTISPSVSNDSISNSSGSNTSKFDLYAKQLLSKNQFDLEKLSRWFIKKFNSTSPLTFAYGVSMYRKSNSKTMDLLTLKTLQTGKTYIVNLLHTFRLIPSLDYFKDSDVQKNFENDNLPQYTQKFLDLEKDCQTIKVLFPTSSISIYNPFFDKYIKKTYKFYQPLTLESSFFSSNQSLTGSSGSINNTSVAQKQQQHTTIVDPISVTSTSSLPSPSSGGSSTSSTPFVSISTTESQSNENILDKLKSLDKKRSHNINNNNNTQQLHHHHHQQTTNSASNINNNNPQSENSIDTDKLASIVAKLIKEKGYI